MADADAHRIAAALEATQQIVSDLDTRSRDADKLLTEIRHDLKSVTETTQKLSVLVWTGNGKDSLMTRMTLMERTIGNLEGKVKAAEAEKSKMRTAMISSMASVIAALGAAAIALFK